MSNTIVFYGAGAEARKKLTKWKAAGLAPACFVDIDTRKHHKNFIDDNGDTEYVVLPLSEAIEKYPDYMLYITLGYDKWRCVAEWLIDYGIPKERIEYIELHEDVVELESGCYDNKELKKWVCMLPFKRMEFYSGGEVTPCCLDRLKLGFHLGNIEDQTYNEIWNSDNAKKLRYSVSHGSFEYCSRRCPHIISPTQYQEMLPRETAGFNYNTWEECSLDTGPTYVNLACSLSCNLHCVSCRKHVVTANSDEIRKLNHLLDNFVRPSLSGLLYMQALGSGEFFTCKPIMEFYRTLSKEEYPQLKLDLFTNGTLFTPKRWKEFANLKGMVNKIKISIDAASKDTYEALRRGGNWEVLFNNVEYISTLRKASEIQFLQMSFVAQRDNYLEMRKFVDFAKLWSADSINFMRVRNWGTYSPEEFLEIDVFSSEHPLYNEAIQELAAVEQELGVIVDPRLTSGLI